MQVTKAATVVAMACLLTAPALAKPGSTRYKPVVPLDQREQSQSEPAPVAPGQAGPRRKARSADPVAESAKTAPAPATAKAPPAAPKETDSSEGDTGLFANGFQFGVAAKVSTLGFGFDVSTPLIADVLNFRIGFNTFSYGYEEEADDDGAGDELNYDGDIDFSSFPLLLDWHPFKGSFRISAGLLINNNEISASATCASATCEFGDATFTSATLGETQLLVDLGGTHPYLGIGFGNSVGGDGGFSFAFDLGVVFQDATIDIRESAACNADPSCRAQAENEEADLQQDVDDLEMYPVISFGVAYQFK